MSGNGRGGGNRRRPFKRRERDAESGPALGQNSGQALASRQNRKSGESPRENHPSRDGFRYDKARGGFIDRPTWSPPRMSTEPIPSPDCAYCGKPIRDMSVALNDRASGAPVHFDCVIARLTEGERLDRGDTLAYIGGGRFGVVHFTNPQEPRNFKIKKILEWEDKENRADWRKNISDHYSLT